MLNPIRNYFSIRADPIRFLSDIVQEHGDFVPFRVLAFPYVLVNDPTLIREALVNRSEALIIRGGASAGLARLVGRGILTNHGDSWRSSRRALQPLFAPSAARSYLPIIYARVEESLEHWRMAATSLDMHQELLALSFRIGSSTLFGWLPSFDDAAAFAHAIRRLQFDGMERYVSGADFFPWFPSAENRRVAEAKATLLRLAQTAARQSGQPVDEIRSIFFAGTESAANTLCFALALLEEHSEWLERVRRSLRDTSGDREPAEEERAGPLAQVISESLRLFPAGWAFERVAREDVELGGRIVRRGTRLLFSPFLLHRNRRFWNEPERFDPSRFAGSPGAEANVPRHAYMPFGAGPRSCIGARLALTEMRVTLSAILGRCRWSIERAPADPPLRAEGAFKIRLNRPLRILLEVA